ncbi:hypothetical protein HanRHA438_Chr15g0692461 [Helianthus annuus]|nr:hypothetical protein HanLR1_Chr15g0564521 [Helianthus annuus]KAJ0843545.1 hypothetical protein HanRHA438_Chr15g0692461 [Helianthus annuus]
MVTAGFLLIFGDVDVPGGASWCPLGAGGADRFIGKDDDGVARMVEGRFLNLQPHFCSHDYWKL